MTSDLGFTWDLYNGHYRVIGDTQGVHMAGWHETRLIREVERLTAQRDWHQARNDALQKVQRHMRDPERKVVCDILANGTTYVEPFRAALAGEGDEP